MKSDLIIGDSVIFDSQQIEPFISETNGSKDLQQYQKIVLGGIEQIGIVKDFNGNMATIAYPDGWEVPVPIKYLLKHSITIKP